MSEDVLLTPGQLLSTAREAIPKTQEEIAEQLHLAVERIKEIEADAFEKIGVRTFVRGYLCSYARLVGIAQTHILEAFDAMDAMPEFSKVNNPIVQGAPVQNVTHQGRYRFLRYLSMRSIVAFVLLLSALLWYWYQPDNSATSVEPARTLSVVEEPMPLSNSEPPAVQVPISTPSNTATETPPVKSHHPIAYTVHQVAHD
ncbi:MAG: hypothetical protein A3E84_05650 [Gammaproteobacteria bacterium RIFCSPHIGHO2_12_FULL_42_13]|nr:MAG: hypothetical protein A3E84_05650 [Gammaproteobacteria bacterium RIFCSPHIGHO2_12_FULL_42_13]